MRANIDLDNDPFSRRPTVPQYGWLSGKKKDENDAETKDGADKKSHVNGEARFENPGDDLVDLSSLDIDVNNPTTRRSSSRYIDDPLCKYTNSALVTLVSYSLLPVKKFDNGMKTITYEEYKKRRENL